MISIEYTSAPSSASTAAVQIDHSRRFAAGKRHVRIVELDDDHELVRSLPRLLEEADAFLAPWLGAPA